jgi:hypothetical protein
MLPTTKKPHVPYVLVQQALIIRNPDTFELHAPDPLADPPVQVVELPQIGGERSAEVIYRTPDNSVNLHDYP